MFNGQGDWYEKRENTGRPLSPYTEPRRGACKLEIWPSPALPLTVVIDSRFFQPLLPLGLISLLLYDPLIPYFANRGPQASFPLPTPTFPRRIPSPPATIHTRPCTSHQCQSSPIATPTQKKTALSAWNPSASVFVCQAKSRILYQSVDTLFTRCVKQ